MNTTPENESPRSSGLLLKWLPLILAGVVGLVVGLFWRSSIELFGIHIELPAEPPRMFHVYGVMLVLWLVYVGLQKVRALLSGDGEAQIVATYIVSGEGSSKDMSIEVLEHLKDKHGFDAVDCPDCDAEGCKRCDDGGLLLDYKKEPCGADCPLRPL
ncbi:hypothetical protein LXT21_04645 [Myxococcus sp. K38C18041901]|uniref:hypothetical protein n=1 Tax=Myxococcus guangdongensis TaxID=2906760 RepID=UPI0020A7154E|nr:hypothetical protein [Myxococcus guangdongensis]MCP3058063.1 hypothetical protein [Myxococcus guangdongensis]